MANDDKLPFDLNDFRPPVFPFRYIPLIILGVVAMFFVLSSVHMIDTQEVGVVQRFGAFNRTLNPGMNLVMPYPIEKVRRVEVERQLKAEFGIATLEDGRQMRNTSRRNLKDEAFMLTGDLNAAQIKWVVQYRIDDPYKYLFKVRNPDQTFRVMNEAVMREVVGDRTINEVITFGRQELLGVVKNKIQELCNQYEIGILVEQVNLQDVKPPDPVIESFNAVNEAQQVRETLINEAQADYNKVVPKARGDAQRAIEEARGYALERVNQARGDSARFAALYNEYRKAREVTRQRIYLETMNTVMQRVGRKLITDDNASGILPLFDYNQGGKK